MSTVIREEIVTLGTTLDRVDLVRGVASFIINQERIRSILSPYTKYITYTLSTRYKVITNILTTYYLNNSIYTIVNTPTRITVESTVVTLTGKT